MLDTWNVIVFRRVAESIIDISIFKFAGSVLGNEVFLDELRWCTNDFKRSAWDSRHHVTNAWSSLDWLERSDGRAYGTDGTAANLKRTLGNPTYKWD